MAAGVSRERSCDMLVSLASLAYSLVYPLPFPLGPWPGWGVTVPALSVWGEVEAEVEPEEW